MKVRGEKRNIWRQQEQLVEGDREGGVRRGGETEGHNLNYNQNAVFKVRNVIMAMLKMKVAVSMII